MSDYKIIKSGKEARELLASGANQLAEPVVSTLGPLSRNVALNQSYPSPRIIHDGVTVAREIRLKNPFEDMGATLLKEAAIKTNDLAGDGTTTATLLANTLIQGGFKLVEGGTVNGVITGKMNPMILKNELLKASEAIIELLDKKAVKLSKKEEYRNVAKISSANDEIADLVADAIEKVGREGLVMVEKSTGFESGLEIKNGLEFDNGYLSSFFVTNPDKMVAEYEDGYVLLTDYTIADAMQLVGIVEQVIKDNNKPLLIIANDVVGPALNALVLTKLKTNAKLIAVMAPEYADRRREMLQDLAVMLGGNVISSELDKKLEDVKISDLGRFSSLMVTQEKTAITPKNPDKEELEERINAIRTQIKNETNLFKKGKLEERMAKLSSRVAIINIGGASETEIDEKRERAIDAVYAVKAALSEGIVPGGGVALRDISFELKGFSELVTMALQAPYATLLKNAGIEELNDNFENGIGCNLITGEPVEMIKEGIIDPVKVTKLAVRHAFSVAAIFLTTDHLVSDDIEKDREIQKVKPV